jgi:streptogramin lyase
VPTAGSRPDQITTGPDGKMWFTHVSTNKIGKATTSSFVDEVS